MITSQHSRLWSWFKIVPVYLDYACNRFYLIILVWRVLATRHQSAAIESEEIDVKLQSEFRKQRVRLSKFVHPSSPYEPLFVLYLVEDSCSPWR